MCSRYTKKECLRDNIFGGTERYTSQVKDVSTGDILFLYDYSDGILHGVFEAISHSAKDIKPDAWGGAYPWQVRVKREEKYRPLSKPEIDGIIFFDGKRGFPKAKVNSIQFDKLISKFKSKERLSSADQKYLKSNPPQNKTKDGHFVRSYAEVLIDDWLFDHKIVHVYEQQVPINEVVICDFYIPSSSSKAGIYIEYWGMNDDKYLIRKDEKIKLYQKYDLKLIQVRNKDLKNLEEVLLV